MTFISERLTQILKLQRLRMPISTSAVGCVNAGTCRYAAEVQLSSRSAPSPIITTIASILPSLTKYAPSSSKSHVDWNRWDDLALADPEPFSPDSIDILIGADLYNEIILEGVRKGNSGEPVAQETIFGWVLSGPTSLHSKPRNIITVQHCTPSLSLEQELRKFWEIEEVPCQRLLSPEEQQCEEHFRQTHSRRSDGRYVVRLPFRDSPITIGESRSIAERQLASLCRRLKLNSQLNAEYSAFLSEYEALGHMKQVAFTDTPIAPCVYVPHHPVIRDSSSTTRLRVVFNASSRTTNGTSLNDHLLVGPKPI